MCSNVSFSLVMAEIVCNNLWFILIHFSFDPFFEIVADAKLSNVWDLLVLICCIVSILWMPYPKVSAVMTFNSLMSLKASLKWFFHLLHVFLSCGISFQL